MPSSIRTNLASFLFVANCHAHSLSIDKFGSFYFPCNRSVHAVGVCVCVCVYNSTNILFGFHIMPSPPLVGDMAEKKARSKTFNPINNDGAVLRHLLHIWRKPNFGASNGTQYDMIYRLMNTKLCPDNMFQFQYNCPFC